MCKVIFGNTQTQSHYTHDIQVTSTLNPNQVPEARLLWLLAASIGSLFSSSGFNTFTGNVTDHCLANGSWYADACGPRGAEALPYRQWRAGRYTAGFAQIDARLFDVVRRAGCSTWPRRPARATTRPLRRARAGGAPVGDGARGRGPRREGRRLRLPHVEPPPRTHPCNFACRPFVHSRGTTAARRCRNERSEAKARGLSYDAPNDYHLLAPGSLGHTASQFLFVTCRRFKYEIFSDLGRAMHQFGYDLAACGQSQVLCKKATIQCLSTCGGVDGSQYKHDFSTIVSLTELSQFVLGEDFDDAAAANCTVKNYKFLVPTFEGGDSFKTFAAAHARAQ